MSAIVSVLRELAPSFEGTVRDNSDVGETMFRAANRLEKLEVFLRELKAETGSLSLRIQIEQALS